jgi:hypothetical protein
MVQQTGNPAILSIRETTKVIDHTADSCAGDFACEVDGDGVAI